MRAEIVSIGTELLLGTITDTNASYLAQRLAALGIDCFYISQVGDNPGRLEETLRRAWERSDLTVTTGGLGPTQDDLTREAIASMLGEQPSVDPQIESELRLFFQRRGIEMPERNLKQAMLIPSANAIRNPVGTAPGWWVERDTQRGRRTIVSMPGVPFEMKRMWEHEVEPRLSRANGGVIVSRTLKVLGLGESAVEEKVADLMSGANPTLAPYAKQDGVHLRITAKASNAIEAGKLISGLERKVRERLGRYIYGTDEDTPWGVARDMLGSSGGRYALLEVGAAGGSIAELGRSEQCLGMLVAPDLDGVARLLGRTEAPLDLEAAAMAVRATSGADVVVAAMATMESVEDQRGSVLATGELVLLSPGAEGNWHTNKTGQTWKTSPSEVARLLGLAAVSFVLRRLSQDGQVER
jgi:nicotinamide-nucleotide amidase